MSLATIFKKGCGQTYLTPHIATRIERAWIQERYVGPRRRNWRALHLRTAHGVGESSRHGWSPSTQANDSADPKRVAAVPGPSVGVETVELICRDVIVRSNSTTIIAALNRVCRTGAIRVRLRCEVRQRPGRTAHMLAYLESRTQIWIRIVRGEVRARDTALLR